jgi:hypothetical protein
MIGLHNIYKVRGEFLNEGLGRLRYLALRHLKLCTFSPKIARVISRGGPNLVLTRVVTAPNDPPPKYVIDISYQLHAASLVGKNLNEA